MTTKLAALDGIVGLSDPELLRSIEDLGRKEREITLEILVHLIEVERRKLHLTLGYPSLFAYCTTRLGYSESGANRRIRSARCIRDFPDVYDLLRCQEVNLSTVALFAGILTPDTMLQKGPLSGA